ncbi:hypothetical protein PCNPT3_02830 [Psychromonas sp. CNPT3]|uniref:hypothetical protein n=1 Tax=Psychromonas sp. CNPT3 TaxID=314282 RepID=UPI00006E8AA5|nr:hypothetical protein [Psychromonas sp. CNPT3]AGH80508.1 hypothetical protein PCNPT3_02830 [Psychromonas sp. CNPT3]
MPYYQKKPLNTGMPRHVMGHFVSGAIGSAVGSASINYARYKDKQIDKNTLYRDSSKAFLQGGISTACAIASANKIGEGNYLGALLCVALGTLSVCAIENKYNPQKQDAPKTLKSITLLDKSQVPE